MIRILILCCCVLLPLPVRGADIPPFGVATRATPVLNRPDLAAALGERDSCGQLRGVEFVALPGTAFTIHDRLTRGGLTIYRVTTADYPYPSATGYYVESAALRPEQAEPPPRSRTLPDREAIVAAMKRRAGTGYVWGGNVAEGVADPWGDGSRTLLAGLDCSGLLYEATGGFTPRNTSSLVTYGRGVPIAGRSAAAIAAGMRPLDLIVWPGHVLIVIDGGNVIESRLVCGKPAEGVRIRPVAKALEEIMGRRRPADRISGTEKEFVVRRWYGNGG